MVSTTTGKSRPNEIRHNRATLTRSRSPREDAGWLIEHGHEEEGLDWTRLILAMKPNHPPTCRFLADYHASNGNQGLANDFRSLLP